MCLFACCDLLDFKTSSSRLKLPALSGFEVQFAAEERYNISPVFKTYKSFIHKEIWQLNGAQTF